MNIDWEKISDFKGPQESPGYLLWQVSTSWRRSIESALAPIQLTHAQFVLLASMGWLNEKNSAVTQVDLARHCSMDITMTSQILRGLEKRGMVKRKHRTGNLRSKFPEVTPLGTSLIKRAIPIVEEVDKRFFEKLGPQVNECVEILKRLSIG